MQKSGDKILPVIPATKYVTFGGRMVIVGFGSIGQGSLPLILKHIDMSPERVTIIVPYDDPTGKTAHVFAAEYRVHVVHARLVPENYVSVLAPLLDKGDFLLNLSVDVSSVALMAFCHEREALYLDTVVEPWLGGYTSSELSMEERTNYKQRQDMLDLKARYGPDAPTAVSCHGANPGLVSHYVKQALLNIARDTGVQVKRPASREEWAALAAKLGIKTIHIAERDTQFSRKRKEANEFVNTWSVDGFISEGCQPAELGWGTHEKELPQDGVEHTFGSKAAIYLTQPGCMTQVRSWTPTEGPYHAFLVTHNEAISIADYFTVRSPATGEPAYRPTVHYAYHPADDAVLSLRELAGKNFKPQQKKRILMDDIVDGMDELGVLLCGHAKGVYWYGSQLNIHRARKLVEHNSATSLQVTSTVLAGVVWAMENPRAGILEADEIPDFERILDITNPYCAPVVGAYSDWTPLQDRDQLFKEAHLDRDDPFQFKNFRV
jgi:homospermidine synthase